MLLVVASVSWGGEGVQVPDFGRVRRKRLKSVLFARTAPRMAADGASIGAGEILLRSTIALDDDLIKAAQEYTGLMEKSALIREALKALIEREASRRLAELVGASPGIASIPRRRAKAK
jgi:Arc/MetJ family transcription regulator